MSGTHPGISAPAARRIALAAQGFDMPARSETAGRRQLHAVLRRTRLLQLDSVNVAVRAHYVPLYSRLGGYPTGVLDDLAWGPLSRRSMVEYWAHEASLIPLEHWPLLRWRMADHHARPPEVVRQRPELAEAISQRLWESGQMGAGPLQRELQKGLPLSQKPPGAWWNRSETKQVCEWMFAAGLLGATRVGFERRYDLIERVVGAKRAAQQPPERAEAIRDLVSMSVRALGIGTEGDIRDYYRLPVADCAAALRELQAAGEVEQVQVPGWRWPAYLNPRARRPRRLPGRALLCPFDPILWRRERAQRLFGFSYRIEIYTPAPQRRYGYYVFPFLLDGQLCARVDLKADRAAGALLVRGVHGEGDGEAAAAPAEGRHAAGRVLPELAAELQEFARWLGLTDVRVGPHGDWAEPLSRILG